jgi:hypothetical protein
MVEWSSLVLPVLLSAVLVFIVSSILHAVLTYHNKDFQKLANEDEVRAAIRKGNSRGMYMIPSCESHAEKRSPETVKKFEEGPVGLLVLRTPGAIKMGPFLGQWFVYTIVVSFLLAYVARSTLHPGATYLQVFRVVSVSGWLAYAWQSPSDSIWKGQTWSATFKALFDGLVYAAFTAGVFGWLWPR